MATYDELRRKRQERHAAAVDAKERLNKAFAKLRTLGFIAKQSFMCCGSCAGGYLADEAVQKVDAGKPVNGCVFYTKQGGFWDGPPDSRHSKVRKLYLQYGPVHTEKYGAIGVSAEEAGMLIQAVLESLGLHVEWDGDGSKTLIVDPCPNLWSNEPRTRFERVA